MNTIRNFVKDFLLAEVEAANYQDYSNRAIAKEKVEAFYSSCLEPLKDKLGVVYDEEDLFGFEDTPEDYKHPRHLFKISHYKNEIYGNIFLAYVSGFLFDDDIAERYRMTDCFCIATIKDELKIIKLSGVDLDTGEWIDLLGTSDISIENLGTFIAAERYLEPVHDKDNMAKYLADE